MKAYITVRQAQGLTRGRQIHVVTIDEMDGYYEVLLQEIEELQKLADSSQSEDDGNR